MNERTIQDRPRVLSTCLLCLIVLTPLLATSASAEEVNRVVLRVNDEILTLHDYEKRKSVEVDQILANPDLSPQRRQESMAEVGKAVMFQIFREMLLESQAKRTGTTASERDIEEAIVRLRNEQNIPSNAALEEALARSGMSMDDLRENVRQEMILGEVVRRDVTGKIEVGEDELRAVYRNNPDAFRVPEERHLEETIVLEESGLPADQLEATAQALYDEVAAGTSFEEAVQKYEDQGVSTGIIDLGWLRQNELGRALHDAAWALEVGGVSPPVDGRGGFHILRLVERRGGEMLPYAEVENSILGRERQRRFGKAFNDYMANLSASSYIVEDIPPEAIGYRSLAEFNVEEELAGFRGPLAPKAAPADEEADDEAEADAATDGEPDEADGTVGEG